MARLVSVLSTVRGGMGLINGVIGLGIARRLSDSKEPPTGRYRRFGKNMYRIPGRHPVSRSCAVFLYMRCSVVSYNPSPD